MTFTNLFELDNEAMMASKRCSSIKRLSLTFVSNSISKSLLTSFIVINNHSQSPLVYVGANPAVYAKQASYKR